MFFDRQFLIRFALLGILCPGWLGWAVPADASQAFTEPEPVTSHPGEDFAPSLVPGGNGLVYVSDRSGNLDLWFKFLGRGVQPPDVRLTLHTSEDNSPAVSPDGRWVAFVSHRTDPKGDIYLLPLKTEPLKSELPRPVRLTGAKFSDRDPAWSPDGDFIYFTSADPANPGPRIVRVNVNSKKRRVVSAAGGTQPTVSPDGRWLVFTARGKRSGLWAQNLKDRSLKQLTSGDPLDVSPRFSGNGRFIYFARYQDDTNKDGQTTIDDRPNLWRMAFSSRGAGRLRQLTDSSTYDLFPAVAGDDLFYTSHGREGTDILRLPVAGILSPGKTFPEARKRVQQLCPNERDPGYRCILADTNLTLDFPSQAGLAAVWYRLAQRYLSAGHPDQALARLNHLIQSYPNDRQYRGLAEIQKVVTGIAQSRARGKRVYDRRNRQGLTQLAKTIQTYASERTVAARAYLESGHLHYALEEFPEALSAYKKVIGGFPRQRMLAAEAAFSRSRVYSTVGDRERLIQAYVQVVRDYYDVSRWSRRAIEEILQLHEQHPTLAKKVSSLQALTRTYRDLPRLAAAVQNRIGALYVEAGENLLAKEAYHGTLKKYRQVPEESDRARFELAAIYAEEENFEMSLKLYAQISTANRSLKENILKARRGTIRKSIEKGQWELRDKEVKLARKTFLKLIRFDPATVEGHRGFIQSMAALGKNRETIEFYRKRLQQKAALPVDHYALGLAYTYQSPPDLERAREEIEQALTAQSNIVFYHQTLGWVFEQQERVQPQKGFMEKAIGEYQVALALNDKKSDPQNEANLILNLGNGNFFLKNYYSAYPYYRKRREAAFPFDNAPQESLFYRRYAESAFKSGRPAEAAELYRKAMALDAPEDNPGQRAELNDRIALAYQDAGQPEKAVEHFSKALEWNRKAGRSANYSRSLRNIANNLYTLAAREPGKSKALNRALSHYFQAIESLERHGMRKQDKKGGSGLLNIDIEAGLDEEQSGAAAGFDKTGEQKLIFHYIGKIFGDFGDYDGAIAYFNKKLKLIPANLDPGQHLPVMLEKALLLNQIGRYQYLAGRYAESRKSFKQSYAVSRRIDNQRGMAVNAANLGRVLALQCRMEPLKTLEGDIGETVQLLEDAWKRLNRKDKRFGSPAYYVYLQNSLGILYHYLGYHLPAVQKTVRQEKVDERQLIADSMSGLDEDLRWIEKSHDSFREALNRAEKIKWPEGSPVISQLRHNRRLAANLLGIAPGEDEVKPPEFLEWQALYLASFQVAGEKRLELLKKSEAMLSGLVLDSPGDSPSLSLMEDLYRALTRLLFERKRYSEALYFSEKGVQQTLMRKLSGLPLKFRDEARAAYYDEIISFRQSRRDWLKQVRDPETGKEVLKSQGDELVREYQDFMGSVAEEDPAFVSLFLPEGVRLEEVQSQLRPGELVLKVSPVSNRILIWAVTAEKVQGYQTDLEGPLLSTLKRLREKPFPLLPEDLAVLSRGLMGPVTEDLKRARSLILVAGGHLEFLPWPALRVDGKMLVERLPVSYQTSLAQYLLSRANRNLYNSRYLAFDYSEENFGRIRKAFISAENYAQERATVDQFQQVFDKYGVWDISGHAALRRLDGSDSYINLTRRRHRFERLSYTDLIGEKQEANFIFLGNVRYEFDPESGVSPSAPLVQALTVTGFPGLVMHTGEADPGYHEAFRVEFFKTFHNAQPAESLRRAQLKMIRRFPRSLAWTRYRFYGYPGMEEQEKARFAEERFMINIRKGIEAVKSKHWLSAINHYEKALALAPFLKDSNASHPLYKGLAQAAFNQGDYPKGIHYQKQALAWAQKGGDPEEMAEAMFMLGILYSRAERYQPAVDYLNRALAFYRENEILDRLAEIYTQLGIVQENALDFGQALQAFSASARVNEEIGEDFYRGQELRRIGRIYYLRLNHYGKAREFYTQAHALFQELGHIEQTIETLMELGLVAEKQGAFEPARGYYRKAQALAETNHLKPQLVKAFFYQGNNSWYQGQYQNAFRFQKQALRIAREIGDKRQQAFIYNTLGLIHWTLNDSVRALENLETSRALAEAVHSPLDVSTAFNNMGLVYRKDKKYEKSIELFQEALKRDTRLKSKWAQGYTHRNLGISYLRLKRLDEAETHFKQAMELSGAINNRINLVKTQLELGHLELARNHCPKAVPIFEETAQRAGRLNIREVLWRALRGQGVCLARQGKVPEAIERYRKAVAVVEEMRAAIKVEEFQNGYLTDKQDVYRELILLLLQMGRVEESFNTAERAKARSFIDLLGNQKISLKNDVSRQLYDRLTAQKQRIRTIEESLKGLSEPEELERAKKELISARIHYRDLLIEAKEQSPEISSFVTVEAITLKKLYGLLEPEVALVEYLVTPRELIAWIVIRDSIRVVRTPLEASRLQAAVKDYRARIQKLAPVEELSRRLYDWVVRPVEKYIAGKRVLGIIPHGILHYLSFASLYDGTSYLVERHPLFYSPSASVLEYTFQRKTDKSGPVKVLALGNPDLGTLNYDLPLAEMEANAIKWNYPEVTVLTREQATESWLQKNIGDYQIIHIASHGEFDAVNPLFSSLKLTKDKEADGNFEVNEVFSLDIQADLVTLSACQTGLGEIVGGDELIGLNRAFIYAGTHALVSSLWRVSDISTAVLIKHFYRNYTVQNKGESLRKAQLLVKKLYPHPSYWAGFNLTGDYR